MRSETVPFTTAMPCVQPCIAAKRCSNSATSCPSQPAPVAAAQRAEQSCFLGLAEDRPGRERPRSDGGAAEEGEHYVGSEVHGSRSRFRSVQGSRFSSRRLCPCRCSRLAPSRLGPARGSRGAGRRQYARGFVVLTPRCAPGEPRSRQRIHQLLEHAAAVAAALGAGQQVDVQVRRIRLVGLGAEIIRMVIAVMRLLHAIPAGADRLPAPGSARTGPAATRPRSGRRRRVNRERPARSRRCPDRPRG